MEDGRASDRSDTGWLLAFSRELRRVDDYAGLVELVRGEVATRFGLTNAWLYVFERDEDEEAVLVAAAGGKADDIRRELPVAPIAGDWLTTALKRDEGPIVIPDARGMEGNPDVARRLGNRTVVNMPIGVVDRALGVLGCGTFGEEGPVPIDGRALAHFVQIANLASVAVARLVLRARDASAPSSRRSSRSASGSRASCCSRAASPTTSTTSSPSSARAWRSSRRGRSPRRSGATSRSSPTPSGARPS